MRARGLRLILILAFLSATSNAWAWGLHYLVTDRALESSPVSKNLAAQVQVESLDSFLKDQSAAVAALFDEYYLWLKAAGSRRFKPAHFDVSRPGRRSFLSAARLNPETVFYDVNRVLPGTKPTRPRVSYGKIAPYERSEKNFLYRFEDLSGQKVSIRSILDTYSDEPDWWFDRQLWNYPEYGYGKIPYGKAGTGSDGAAFHTQFAHENLVVRLFSPELLDGMASERLELFTRLARLALRTAHPYWGYRFLAWAIHYIQDLSQPYHAKAAPGVGLGFYFRFIFASDKDRIKREISQLEINRHYLYEDFAKALLQKSYLAPDELSRRIAGFLRQGPPTFPDGTTQLLFKRVSSQAASQALSLDQAIVKAYGHRMTEDPSYDLEADDNYDSQAIFERFARPEVRGLLEEVKADFELTGAATRTLLELGMSGNTR